MMAEIMPTVEEFDQAKNNETEYEDRLQAAADKFIIIASGLPRASGCFPPCVQEITAEENNRTQMWCEVPFILPSDVQIVWRYTEVKTVLMDRFKEVTVGVDKLYSIPSARPEHSGTYQCEMFSQERSLVRIYYHLSVTPRAVVGHVKLQDVFDQALLPAGHFPLTLPQPPFALLRLPSPDLLTVCLSSLLLLLFLTLGLLYYKTTNKKDVNQTDQEREPHRERYILHTT